MVRFFENAFDEVLELFSGFTSKIIIALIILLIGFILARVISRLLERVLKGIKLNKILKEISGLKISFEEIITHFVMYFIYFVSIIMALRHIGIATDVLNIISGVIILLIGVFIVLSVKDFIPNIISGILLHQKSIIKKGDEITTDGITGKVKEITLLDTKVVTKSGDIIIIPNSNLTKKEIRLRGKNQKISKYL